MVFFIIWVGCWLPIAALIVVTGNWRPHQPLQSHKKLFLLIPLYLLAPLIFWVVTALTDTSFSDYGVLSNISILGSFALGLSLALLSLALMFFWQLWLGWCKFNKSNIKQILSLLLPTFLVAVVVGGVEELVFRGFVFTQLQRDYSLGTAAAISSLIFAILHLVWEQRETAPQLPGLWLMGMVLVLARFADNGNLGLAWGLHAGWVWAIATLDTAQLIECSGEVSPWLTGKNQKPLAGVVGILCLLLTGVILLQAIAFFPTLRS
jgi:membrane protease YdiL (CAAX protease family)